ncbi:MAG: hypothetical protein KGI71_04845 [Patescibacteria group bacterium]|nr:hypothetical protein [Patescibacteria group bacterium]
MPEDQKTNEPPEPKPEAGQPPPAPVERADASIDIASNALKTAHVFLSRVLSKLDKTTVDKEILDLLAIAHDCVADGDEHLDHHIALAKNAKMSAGLLAGIFTSMAMGMIAGAHTATPKQPGRGVLADIVASLSPETKASMASALQQALPMVSQWLQAQQEQNAARAEAAQAACAAAGAPPPPADAP